MRKKVLTILAILCLLPLFSSCGDNADNNTSKYTEWRPTVKQAFGTEPKIVWSQKPGTTSTDDASTKYYLPPGDTVSYYISKGNGASVQTNESVVVNYYGCVYGKDEAFDSTFTSDREPAIIKVGADAIVKGWDIGITGKKVGSRIAISIPPKDGFGTTGNSNANIDGADTMFFVVDIVKAYAENLSIPTNSDLTNLKSQVDVTGVLGEDPNINLIENAKEPKKLVSTVIAKGNGEKVKNGNYIVTNYKSITWTGQTEYSTWATKTLSGMFIKKPRKKKKTGSVFSQTIGLTVGTRLLVQTPSKENTYPSMITVIDILAVIPKSDFTHKT